MRGDARTESTRSGGGLWDRRRRSEVVEGEAAVGATRDDEMAPEVKWWRFVGPPETKRKGSMFRLTPKPNEGGNEQRKRPVMMRVYLREMSTRCPRIHDEVAGLYWLWKSLVQKSVIANGSRRTNSFQLITKTLMSIKGHLIATEDESSILEIKERKERDKI